MMHAETWTVVVSMAVGIAIGWLAGRPVRRTVKREASRSRRILDTLRLGERS